MSDRKRHPLSVARSNPPHFPMCGVDGYAGEQREKMIRLVLDLTMDLDNH